MRHQAEAAAGLRHLLGCELAQVSEVDSTLVLGGLGLAGYEGDV